jgi:heat shock protein HslJ
MNRILFFSLILFFVSACNSNPKAPSSSSIVGKWKVNDIVIDKEATTQAEKESLSSFEEQMKMFKEVSVQMPLQLTFFEDNSFTIGAMMLKLPGTYKLSGDELTLEMKNAKTEVNGKAQPAKLIVEQPDSKHLNLKIPDGKGALQLERVE